MSRRHLLGRCQWCDHFYEDHGGDDQCPGDYGGEPRCRPTWEPPRVDRLLELDGPRCEASARDLLAEATAARGAAVEFT